jgi:hypothetical protein
MQRQPRSATSKSRVYVLSGWTQSVVLPRPDLPLDLCLQLQYCTISLKLEKVRVLHNQCSILREHGHGCLYSYVTAVGIEIMRVRHAVRGYLALDALFMKQERATNRSIAVVDSRGDIRTCSEGDGGD